jgi:methyltransferase family protein
MTRLLDLPSFSVTDWQMSFGERAAIEGVVAQLQPKLAIEIGTAEGGSLKRIAAHSRRTISFDLVEPHAEIQALDNVELRTGDSHELLPRELERLAEAGENVDFVLVDGDHSADGAQRDMEDLLASEAVGTCVILAHDTLNQEVRAGLERVPYDQYGKVAFRDFDFVGGYVPADPPLRGECWGGLGLVIVDESGEFKRAHEGGRARMAALSDLIWPSAEAMRGSGTENGMGASEAERQRQLVAEMQSSLSWRITAPLRAGRARLRR